MNRQNGKLKQTPAGRFLSIRRQRSKCWTLICAELLVAAHVMLLLPAPARAATPTSPPEPANALGALISVPSQGQSPGRSPREERLPNREVPDVDPPPLYPSFSLEPTDEEIFRARVFREPLIPMDGETNLKENRALADAVIAYLAGGNTENFHPLQGFLNIYPSSRWRASLLTNLGIVYQRTGFYSRAKAAFEEAWNLSKGSDEPDVRAMADLAITELMDLYMPIGDLANLERLLVQVEGREMGGSTHEKRLKAEGTVWGLKNAHETAIPSGRVAVERLWVRERPNELRNPELDTLLPTMDGATLTEVEDLAGRVGLQVQRAYRQNKNQAGIPVPSVAHLKGGHFTTVVAERNGRYKLDDPLLGGEIWMSREAFEEESTGYFLIAGGRLPPGWRKPPPQEVDGVRGKCHIPQPGEWGTREDDIKDGECSPCQKGMATYAFHTGMASLNITDNPLGYNPPVGPSVQFRVTYNQREATQPQSFTYSNLGYQWTHDWLAYVEDDPSNLGEPVDLMRRGGGGETYSGFENNASEPQIDNRAIMAITSTNPIEYERRLPDGSVEIYAQPDGAATAPRKVFLSEWQDPQGNAVTLTYDGQLRLVSVTDAIGQVTTLSYEMTTNPLRITKVTDPFGREAILEYDESEKLVAITDVIGMTSEFTYGSSYFIRSMTTPYGTTTFRGGNYSQSLSKYLEATDPLGGTERVDYYFAGGAPTLPSSDSPEDVPVGFAGMNNSLNLYVGVYWDKLAMSVAEGDPNKGVVTRFAYTGTWTLSSYHKSSEKKPLENRVWYAYDGNEAAHHVGPLGRPSRIGRVLDDGSSQIYRYEYNSRGKITRSTDPVGRETLYEYDTNEIDLLNVRQANPESPGGYDLLRSVTHNSQHSPLTVTDAAGVTVNTYTYNAEGQVDSIVTPELPGVSTEDRTTTYSYDEDGYMEGVEGPLGATASYTYDAYGRLASVTDPEGYTETYEYDDLDRLTKVTYPDNSFQQVVYERLDAVSARDRLGRWTHGAYDALRRSTAATDPLGRTTTQQWCSCGILEALVDANGNRTEWERDTQGRVTKVIRANGGEWLFAYEDTTSRIKTTTDAMEQVKTYTYFLDNNLQGVSYTNEENETPNVSFTYEAAYNRPSTMTDGTGTTTYEYQPITSTPLAGAGKLVNINGPLANDTMTYTYDQLGRLSSRTIDGVGLSYEYDAVGRVLEEDNPLGRFTYEYDGVTIRPESVTYPNGQVSAYSYYANSGDHRLQEIHHKKPDGSTIYKFSYEYDVAGNITTWTQQEDANPAKAYDLEYDQSSQLRRSVWRTTDPTPTVLKRYFYAYDRAGNRTVEQIDDAPVLFTYDEANRLTNESAGGTMRFAGELNETASVTIQSLPATVDSDNNFVGEAQVSSGTSQVVVRATDYTGNERTNTYEVSVSGPSGAFTYDANGNMTGDGDRDFEWDAENRLVAVVEGEQTSEFTYNGAGQRIRFLEKTGSTTDADRWFVYCNDRPCEERDSSGSVVKRFYAHGFQESGNSFFYTKDHLGSVRTVADSSVTVRALYEYDPFGRRTRVTGNIEADLGFTGHIYHIRSGLHLAKYRSYDAKWGRWLTQDPKGQAEFTEGPNLYEYVRNNPIGFRDPLGLELVTFTVLTSIQPPMDFEQGLKSWHQVVVDTSSGTKVKEFKGIGDTRLVGQSLRGRGSLVALVFGGNGCVIVTFLGAVASWPVALASQIFLGQLGQPSGRFYINYFFLIKYNANTGGGHLWGIHDGFPSYEVWKNAEQIYQYSQGIPIIELLIPRVIVDKPF